MKFCLDTSIVVGNFRNRKESNDLFLDVATKGDVFISVVTYAELQYGTFRVRDRVAEEERIADFLAEFNVAIEPLTDQVAKVYAGARFLLEKKGEKVDNFDLLIGATAVIKDSFLVTHDINHFQCFPQLKLYNRLAENSGC